MTKKQSASQLDEIESITLGHYNDNAQSFWLGTKDHDVDQNINAFLQALPKDKALDILDFGCGPGRDLITFKKFGHKPIGLDGSEEFCTLARINSECPVLHMSFLDLELGEAMFDGIFANASLFHVPSQELASVLGKCFQALRPGGILFASNPRGSGEGWQGERYGNYMEYEQSNIYMQQAGFEVLHHYYRPQGQPIHLQPWLAMVCQRD
jgi:SAM-dependent methyltransferase